MQRSDPHHQQRLPPPDPSHYYSSADDEISLFEIWDALLRHRWLIASVTALVLVAAGAYGYFKPTTYPYRTAINVGSYNSNETDTGRQYIAQPAAVRRKLKQAYIPKARKALDGPDDPDASVPKVEIVSNSKTETGLLVLRTNARPEQDKLVQKLHERIKKPILSRHQSLLQPRESRRHSQLDSARTQLAYLKHDAVERARIEPHEQAVNDRQRKLQALQTAYRTDRRNLEDRLSAKKRRMEQLEQGHERLQARLDRIDERRALADEQLDSTQELLDTLKQAQAQATGQVSSSADAMTLLTVGSQISDAQTRADNLEQRLRVDLPSRRDKLHDKLADNKRTQEQVTDKIDSLEEQIATRKENYERNRGNAEDRLEAARTKLAHKRADYENAIDEQKRRIDNAQAGIDELVSTQALFTADRGLEQAGIGIKMLVALGGVLGGMLGVFSAFAAEFAQAARQRRKQPNGAGDSIMMTLRPLQTSPIRSTPSGRKNAGREVHGPASNES